jgi:NTP pyrophosphatase (non-canonical NTP hydrolase)
MDKNTTLDFYEKQAQSTDRSPQKGMEGLNFALLGLFGEVGTLLSALKKKQRDGEAIVGYKDAVIEEFGDVLWYFSNIVFRAGLTLSEIAHRASEGAANWNSSAPSPGATFADVQQARALNGATDSPAFEIALLGLAGKAGRLLDDASKLAENRFTLSGHLVEIFREVVRAANIANIDLGEAAAANFQKTYSMWPPQYLRTYPKLFDDDFVELERLPRQFQMELVEIERNGKKYVIQSRNDVIIGDAVTDNRVAEDDYRFHDVFHISYAAILGWSPVLRALFKLKRKSQSIIDEVQDGARAILVEECVSNLVFEQAVRLNYFESLDGLDYSLMKLIPHFVKGREVEVCQLWQWERAILEGYRVFRKFRQHRKGVITADLEKRTIDFVELK